MSVLPSPESTEPNSVDPSVVQSTDALNPPLTPQRCLVGSAIASVLAYAAYLMTTAIAQTFAVHKVHSTSLVVQRLSAAVRTLVIGMTTMGMGIFGLAAIGLLALAIQLILQRRNQTSSSDPN